MMDKYLWYALGSLAVAFEISKFECETVLGTAANTLLSALFAFGAILYVVQWVLLTFAEIMATG